MNPEYDAIIVGGGPAGLASAIALGEGGCRALVCERRTLPADKPCGEGIMPTGVVELLRLGVLSDVPQGSCRAFNGVHYVSPSGHEAAARFAWGSGLAIRRTALSSVLFARARRTRGVDVRVQASVQLMGQTSKAVTVEVDGRTFRTPLLVGADGLHSHVRRWAGLSMRTKGARRWGARQHFAVEPWNDSVEVHFSPGVEAYVTPVSGNQVGVAMLWDRDRSSPISGGRLMEDLLAHFPTLQHRLRRARPTSFRAAAGPLLQPARAAVRDRVLLIGDAAGYIDALTGEGISLALVEARALGSIIAPALRTRGSGALWDGALQDYARAVTEITRPYRQLTRLLLWAGRHPVLVERLVAAFAEDPLLLQHFLSANMGLCPPWRLPRGHVSPFLRRLLHPEPPRDVARCAMG